MFFTPLLIVNTTNKYESYEYVSFLTFSTLSYLNKDVSPFGLGNGVTERRQPLDFDLLLFLLFFSVLFLFLRFFVESLLLVRKHFHVNIGAALNQVDNGVPAEKGKKFA